MPNSGKVVRLPVKTITWHKRLATQQAQCLGHVFKDKWKYHAGGGVGRYHRHCSKCGALLELEIDTVFGDGTPFPTGEAASLRDCKGRLRATAIHEAGHAVAFERLLPMSYSGALSITPGDGKAGFHQQEEVSILADDHSTEADQELHNEAVVYCAGYAACIAAGYSEHEAAEGCGSDFDRVLDPNQLEAIKREAVALMRKPENIDAVNRIADELMVRKQIDGDMLMALLSVATGEATEADYLEYLQLRQIDPVV